MATIFSPSSASGYIVLKGKAKATSGSLADIIDFRDADDNSFDSVNLEMFTQFSVEVTNISGDPITDVQFLHSTDNSTWEVVDATNITAFFTGLVAGNAKTIENSENTRSFLRIQAQTAGPAGSARVTLQGRVSVG